ncbi:ABC transporter permease family protein [Halostella salina]|uniref:ABC transporter permease subunit n=1 Tax=Halostella salina TaxID=1547897 RepID=UPI000EF80551|nr:ABC transporter permease subunit [Halostella salina]
MTPSKVLRIARWEVSKSAGTVDRRTAVLAVVGVVFGALVGPAVVSGGLALNEGIYRVGVADDSPYHDVVESSPAFAPGEPTADALAENRVDLVVVDGTVRTNPDTPAKSDAALAEFRSAVERYNDDVLMRAEPDQNAAFPVEVAVRYESRTVAQPTAGGAGGGDTAGGGTTDGGTDGGTTGDGTDGGATDGSGDTSDGSAGAGADGSDGDVQAPNVGGGVFGGGDGDGTPGGLSPPFPFTSLVLAFLFVVPMNFVVQAYGSTIMDERLNRRGELMLVSPVTRGDIVAGKTLPYLVALLAVTVGVAAAVGGGPLSVAAVVPLALLFLGATFVGAMFARSFKELTFVTITVSVFLTSYAFVPAIFADVTPIALISPLTLVVWDLGSRPVSVAEFAFSAGPALLTAVLLFVLGAGVYREEDMFTQRPVPLKALDALATRISRPRSVALVTAASIPFVFVVELLAVALLFALPLEASLPVLLVAIAVIEEVAKSVGSYAGFVHARYDRALGTALVVGALSGVGFFAAEKVTAIVQAVGLTQLELGRAAFATAGGTGGSLLLVGLAASLALHVVTAAISAVGARRGPYQWVAGVGVAVIVHVAYNAAVIGSV